MGSEAKHSKKRNVGLVYEFLVREVCAAALAHDRGRAAKAAGFIDRHLSPGTVLGRELAAHQTAFEQRGCGPAAARRIVDELRAAGIRLSARQEARDRAKTTMIHEANREFGRDFFDRHRIPDYRAHASIGMVLNRGLGRLEEGISLVRIEEALVGWLAAPAEAPQSVDRDATALAYGNAVRIFEEELGKELTPQQRDLLRERVRTDLGGSSEPLQRLLGRQRDDLRRFLEHARTDREVLGDPEMAERLNDTIRELREPIPAPTDDILERHMLMLEVRREIES